MSASEAQTRELAELQRALGRVCTSESPSPSDVEKLGGDAHLVYRRMVRFRIEDLHASALPLTLRALGRPALDALVGRFLAEAPPRSRFFRELPVAFAQWADALVNELPAAPAHTQDALRLDALRWETRWRWAPAPPQAPEPFALERIPVAAPTLRRLDLQHGVHRAPPEDGASWPERATFYLCVHRRPDHVVETRWMDEVGALLVDGWRRGEEPAITTVQRVLESRGQAADQAFVDRMTSLLTGLLESGALLGSR